MTDSVVVPDRTLPNVAADIRRVHALCQEWRTRPNAPEARARWTRYFLSGYGIWGLAIALLLGRLVPALGCKGVFGVVIVIGTLCVMGLATLYALIGLGIDLVYLWKDVRVSGSPFQRDEDEELERELNHLRSLLAIDEGVLAFVAASQETKAKRMEERLSFLKGFMVFAMSTLAGFILPWSPIVKWLTEGVSQTSLKFNFVFGLQGFALAFAAGSVIGLGAAWRERVACTNRYLHIRRVIDQRDFLVSLDRPAITTPQTELGDSPDDPAIDPR